MEFLRQTWLQVQQHLKGLSASQKVAIGLCVALIGVSLAWLVHWSVTPEMVPLLNQSFKPKELTSAQQVLDGLGVRYEIRGDKVLVPAGKRDWLLARLQESEALPSDISIGFARLMEEQSIWLSHEDSAWRREVALGNELARVLRRFRGVREARVFIDRPVRRAFGRARGEPKASVYLSMAPGVEVGRAFIDAVAGFVSGAVVGLRPESVSIVDATTGRRFVVPSADSPIATDLLEIRRKKEEYYTQKILNQLRYIPGVLVGVFAEIETEARRIESRKLGTPLTIEEETTTTTERSAFAGAEPGTMPNVARQVPAASSGQNREESSERAKYAKGDETVTVSENLRGVIKRLTASINVPRSYLVNIFKQRSGKDAEPTDAELQQIISEQLALIRQQVKPLIDATVDDQIQVGWFYDLPLPEQAVLASTTDFRQLLSEYARPAGLASLAMVSLVMLLMLVRKGQQGLPAALGPEAGGDLATPTRKQREELLTVDGGPIGRAQPSEPVLEGREVDEGTLKSQRIIQQVNDLVRDDPDSVASMLRRWIEEAS